MLCIHCYWYSNWVRHTWLFCRSLLSAVLVPGVFVSPELEQNSLPEGKLHTQGVGTVAVKLKKRKLETEQKPENIFYSDSLFLELLHSIHLVPIIHTSSSMYSVDVQPCHLQYCYLVPALVEKHYLVGCSVVWRSSSFSRMLPGQHPECQPGSGCGKRDGA